MIHSLEATSIGTLGGGMGYRTLPDSVGVEFDTVYDSYYGAGKSVYAEVA